MKYITLIFAALLFAGCDRSQGDIDITGTAAGISIGNVAVRDQANNTIYSVPIESGKFAITKRFLQYSGYYKLAYSTSKGSTRKVDIYLQPGTYTIKIDQEKINNYPVITSTSKIQDQLSAYYTIADAINAGARQQVVAINTQLKTLDKKLLRPGQYTTMVDSLQTKEMLANQVDALKNLTVFMNKYPDNEVAAHIMLAMDYQSDPVSYYNLFQKFSSAAKSSDDGKELEAKLKPMIKLATGGMAPELAGTTPDGKTIDIKGLGKKIILIDFWRAGNQGSHDDHKLMINDLLKYLGKKGLGIVGVSFDTDKDKWVNAIKDEKLNWPQISDLKGDDSPNGENWGVKSIPSYCLLDGSGHIIARSIDFSVISATAYEYVAKNH